MALPVKESLFVKEYFWPYDLFGYFLPGLVMIIGYSVGNSTAAKLVDELWAAGRFVDLFLLSAIAYVFGHVVAATSSWLLERRILRGILKYPTTRLFGKDGPANQLRVWAGRIGEALVPGYLTSYSTEFQNRFQELFSEAFSIRTEDARDRFHLCWSYVCLFHPPAYRRASHFIDLYGFSRNISMSFLLLSPAPLLHGWSGRFPGEPWSLICLLVAGIMFVNYAKLLKRLDNETYRAFVTHASTRKL